MTLLQEFWPVILLFFGVAMLYSSVGFGGGSSYLAILTLFGFQFSFLRALALLCNIIVVSNGTIQFWRKGLLNFKKILPLAITSVPLAYLGGKLPLKEQTFFILLGITLIIAALLMWFQKSLQNSSRSQWMSNNMMLINVLLGGIIGFISGMVGIGGGIFLAPVLYLLKWDEPKKISATASFFILVNSLAGLMGQAGNPNFEMNWTLAFWLMGAVGIGGLIGTYVGTVKFNPNTVRKATAILIFYVAVNILTKYLF